MREKVKALFTDDDDYEFLALPASPSTNSNPAQPPGLPAIGQRLRVETVEQYLTALKQGAGAYTGRDHSLECLFYLTTGTLKFLNQADDSRRSLLPKELPMKLLYSLPVRFLGYGGSDQEANLTLRYSRHSEKLWIFNSDQTSVQFEFSGKRYCLSETARGDFNQDGSEDSLVLVIWHYLDGSGGGVQFLLVEAFATPTLKATYFPLP
jgi:hypothetical protein